MKIARRLYKLLLTLYPHSYRTAFGEQMMQTFIDHYTDVATSVGRVRMDFWLFMIIDEIKNIMRQQMISLREDRTLLTVTVAKVVVSAVLLIPLSALCYAILVNAILAVPHPPVSGIGFLIALAALVLFSGVLSVVVSYVLASLVVRALPKRSISTL